MTNIFAIVILDRSIILVNCLRNIHTWFTIIRKAISQVYTVARLALIFTELLIIIILNTTELIFQIWKRFWITGFFHENIRVFNVGKRIRIEANITIYCWKEGVSVTKWLVYFSSLLHTYTYPSTNKPSENLSLFFMRYY